MRESETKRDERSAGPACSSSPCAAMITTFCRPLERFCSPGHMLRCLRTLAAPLVCVVAVGDDWRDEGVQMSDEMPVTDVEVPTVQPVEGVPVRGLPVCADGVPAQIFVVDRGFASDKIAIEFETPHPRFDDNFATKHFYWPRPGELGWGHDGEIIRVTHRSAEQTAEGGPPA